MSNTAALLGTLLNTNADINYYTQQQLYWSQLYEANQVKLNKQVKYEEQYGSAYDSAMNNTKELTANHGDISVVVAQDNQIESIADQYAHAKVYQYDEALSEELANLDLEYDTMQTMYEALLESLRAQKESEKSATQQAASDTGLLQGG